MKNRTRKQGSGRVKKGETREGTVVRLNARHAVVRDEDGSTQRCTLRKSLFHELETFTNPVAVGDRVEITVFGRNDAVVEKVLPRRGWLSRKVSEKGLEQVLVANVDQVVVCASLVLPDIRTRLVDRVLVAAERAQFEALVVLTKIDLIPEREIAETFAEFYTRLGYPAILVSNETGEGIEELARSLEGKTSVFSGPSGAGKSTTLNSIQPGLRLEAREVSERWGKGKHTTTAASLLPLERGGFVVDTPGFRSFGIAGLEPNDVAIFMPDIAPHVQACHHNDCSHTHEPQCAVRVAVEEGQIHPERFESYLRMAQGIEEEDEKFD